MAVKAFQFYSHCNSLCVFLLKGGSVPGCHQLFLGLLLKFLHFLGHKLFHLCDVLYLNKSVFVCLLELSILTWVGCPSDIFWGVKFTLFWISAESNFICFVKSSYDMPAPERCNSFMVFLLPVKRWATNDKATAFGNFSLVTRLCQSQATDLR